MPGKRIAILQSNYIPWKGYFDMINMVDEFILYDDVQYTKNDWRNRNQIKTPQGVQWLTIPVLMSQKFGQKIRETQVSSPTWGEKHWKTIKQNYCKAPFFAAYRDQLEGLYLGTNEPFLSQVNYRFIKEVCGILGIRTKLSWSMDYELKGDKSERLVGLCLQAGATEYLSGPAARDYLDEALFAAHGIKVSWMDYSGYPEYSQLFPPFVHGVSIIDLILNEGTGALAFMKSRLQNHR